MGFLVTWFVVCVQVCGVWSGMAPAEPYMGRRKDCRCVPKTDFCAIEVLPLSVVAASSFAPYTCVLGTRMCCDSVPHHVHTDDRDSNPSDVDTLMVKVPSLERYHDKQLRYSTAGKTKNAVFNLEESMAPNEDESEFLVSEAYSNPQTLINSHLTPSSVTENAADYISHNLVEEKDDKYLFTPDEHETLPDSAEDSRDTRSESANGSLGYNYGRFIENKFNLFFTRYEDNLSNSTQFSEYRNYTSVNATSTLLNTSSGNTLIQSASGETSVNLPDSPYVSLLTTRYTDTMDVMSSTNEFSISSEDLQTLETILSISTDSTPVVQVAATLTSTLRDGSDSNSSVCDPSLAHCNSNRTPTADLHALDQPEDSVASNESLSQAVFSMLVSSNNSSSGASEDTMLLDDALDVTTPPNEEYGFWYWFWTWLFG